LMEQCAAATGKIARVILPISTCTEFVCYFGSSYPTAASTSQVRRMAGRAIMR
jgi:hypothetical protein